MITYTWKVEFLKDRKKWRIRIELGEDSNGQRKYKTKTLKAKKRREAVEEGRIYFDQFTKGAFVNNDLTFNEFVEEWKEKYAESNLSPTTLQARNNLLKKHIIPVFGNVKLRDIHVRKVVDFIHQLEQKNLSNGTIGQIRHLLKSIINIAIKWQLLDKNPVDGTVISKKNKNEVEVLSESEINTLLKSLDNEHFQTKTLIKLALSTGMRKGELLGLQWNDINLVDNSITIQHSLKYLNNSGHYLGTTKTNTSRTITVDSNTLKQLREFKKLKNMERLQLGEKWKGCEWDLIFTTPYGTPLYLVEPNKVLNRLLKQNDMKKIKFHALRHTHATYLLLKGINIKVIQERLGHSNINMTLNTYSHVLKEMDLEAVNVFETLYRKA